MNALDPIQKSIVRALISWFEEEAQGIHTGEKWVAADANSAARDVLRQLEADGYEIVRKLGLKTATRSELDEQVDLDQI